jgi:predicted HTH domain antitoxin
MGRERDDAAVQALVDLKAKLQQTISDLSAANERAERLIELRRRGTPWYDIVTSEERPLIIESITRALDDLGELGSRFRREEALALQREKVSITRIGELFRVSRQRVSALLQERSARALDAGRAGSQASPSTSRSARWAP